MVQASRVSGGCTTPELPAKQAGRALPLQRTQAARETHAQAGWNRGIQHLYPTPEPFRGGFSLS